MIGTIGNVLLFVGVVTLAVTAVANDIVRSLYMKKLLARGTIAGAVVAVIGLIALGIALQAAITEFQAGR